MSGQHRQEIVLKNLIIDWLADITSIISVLVICKNLLIIYKLFLNYIPLVTYFRLSTLSCLNSIALKYFNLYSCTFYYDIARKPHIYSSAFVYFPWRSFLQVKKMVNCSFTFLEAFSSALRTSCISLTKILFLYTKASNSPWTFV